MPAQESPSIDGRSPFLPEAEQVSSHPLVKAPHGPIFIMKGRQEDKWMEGLLQHVAVKKCPKNRQDAERQGDPLGHSVNITTEAD